MSHSSGECGNLQIKYLSYWGLWFEKLHDLNSEEKKNKNRDIGRVNCVFQSQIRNKGKFCLFLPSSDCSSFIVQNRHLWELDLNIYFSYSDLVYWKKGKKANHIDTHCHSHLWWRRVHLRSEYSKGSSASTEPGWTQCIRALEMKNHWELSPGFSSREKSAKGFSSRTTCTLKAK